MGRGSKIAAGAGIGVVVLLLILLNIAILLGGIAALAWGIYDTATAGANFWSILWIVVGGLIVLGSVFSRAK